MPCKEIFVSSWKNKPGGSKRTSVKQGSCFQMMLAAATQFKPVQVVANYQTSTRCSSIDTSEIQFHHLGTISPLWSLFFSFYNSISIYHIYQKHFTSDLTSPITPEPLLWSAWLLWKLLPSVPLCVGILEHPTTKALLPKEFLSLPSRFKVSQDTKWVKKKKKIVPQEGFSLGGLKHENIHR